MVSSKLVAELMIGAAVNGSIYSIMSVGLSLVYGVTRVFNFAYGSFFVWGAYFAWLILPHSNYPASIVAALVIMFGLGLLCDRVAVHPLRWKPQWDTTTMMSTLGLAIFLDNVALVAFGPWKKTLPYFVQGGVQIGGVAVSLYEISVISIAISVALGVELFLNKTRLGMSMQAVSQDMEGARIVGIRIDRVFALAFALSASLVTIASVLLAPKIYFSPLAGWDVLVKAFVVIALGGLGSTRGVLYAAYILAIVEAMVGFYLGMNWVMIGWFIVLLAVLTVRPMGIAGVWG